MHALVRTLALALLLVVGSAHADPKAELHQAFTRFLAAKSFRAELSDLDRQRTVAHMEFVAPDRYRVQVEGAPGDQVIIGDTVYMTMNGQTMRVPVPAAGMTRHYRDPDVLAQTERNVHVERVGSDRIDGEAASVYHYTVDAPHPADVKLWISDKSGLPLQMQTTGTAMGQTHHTQIRYRDYDDASIRIEAPN